MKESRAPMVPLEAVNRATGGLRERLDFFFFLLLVYLFFEFGRPSNPLGIPMLISILSLGGWLVRRDKRWSPQMFSFLAFLAVMGISSPMAVNTYASFWATYGMAVVLLCICVPMPSLVTSVHRIKVWSYTFVAVALYVGGWAAFHNGYGPSAAGGGQDENYVAAMMGMAIPFAYFSIFAETRRVPKVLLTLSILVLCGAVVAAENASRGGFIGLCVVFLYCLARSQRKWIGLSLITVVAVVVFGTAGPQYWDEIATIKDVHEGTADMRLEVWTIGLRMFAANPVLGVGPGNFRWVVGEYQSPEQREKYGRDLGGSIIAHSLFVELLAELGLAGVAVVIALLWRTFADLRKVMRRGTVEPGTLARGSDLIQLRAYADAVAASLLGCLVNGAFLSLLYFSYMWLMIALGSAIMNVSRSQIAAQRKI